MIFRPDYIRYGSPSTIFGDGLHFAMVEQNIQIPGTSWDPLSVIHLPGCREKIPFLNTPKEMVGYKYLP
jgi:hypothetical protein